MSAGRQIGALLTTKQILRPGWVPKLMNTPKKAGLSSAIFHIAFVIVSRLDTKAMLKVAQAIRY